jgi:ADP-ribosylglycohydrolase
MSIRLQEQIVNSALWAAYADALGFISELTDQTGLRRRAKVDRIIEATRWTRLVGGRFGAAVELPAGAYSDDTQLRLSTSRAIDENGHFDVEAFAKIELPVWLSYSLGAGAGTKAAATNLSNTQVNWFSNFFKTKNAAYIDGGGNGAAMRIQPHVWASTKKGDPETFLSDVLKNAVTTHGHPRAIVGAALHACTLGQTMNSAEFLEPSQWLKIAMDLQGIVDIVAKDRELGIFWLPVWEERSGTKFEEAIATTLKEIENDIRKIEALLNDNFDESYRKVLGALGCLDQSTRGSAAKTVIAALSLTWLYRKRSPLDALITAVNVLGSDTDTIATIAASMFGAVTPIPPPGEIQDRSYIEAEANRLHEISAGRKVASFRYPDLMNWVPPKSQSSVVGLLDENLFVSGLGKAQKFGDQFFGQGRDPVAWQWLRLNFGQTVLAKVRNNLSDVPRANLPTLRIDRKGPEGKTMNSTSQDSLFPIGKRHFDSDFLPRQQTRSLDELTSEAIRADFDAGMIGRHILSLSERVNGIELAIAYVSILAKAKRARAGRKA